MYANAWATDLTEVDLLSTLLEFSKKKQVVSLMYVFHMNMRDFWVLCVCVFVCGWFMRACSHVHLCLCGIHSYWCLSKKMPLTHFPLFLSPRFEAHTQCFVTLLETECFCVVLFPSDYLRGNAWEAGRWRNWAGQRGADLRKLSGRWSRHLLEEKSAKEKREHPGMSALLAHSMIKTVLLRVFVCILNSAFCCRSVFKDTK